MKILKRHYSLFSRQTKIAPYFQGLQKFVSLEPLEIDRAISNTCEDKKN